MTTFRPPAGLKGNYTNPVVVDFSKSVDVRPTIQRSATTVTRYADDSEHPLKAMRAIPTVDWYDQGTDASDGLPPPPAQLMDRRSDSDDDFPLPPPPDMDAVPVIAKSDVAPIGGIQLMHSLSVKLASRNSVASRAPPPVAAKTFRTSHVDRSASVDQATTDSLPTVDNSSLLAQIQRGMSLRRAVTNDRSAPRVPGKN